ncbi:MAG: glycosyltransferase family 39 protein [Phycisphaerales bacterium]|nr:MAG: glycosyltransferase family 39 protein [Phycisphaerales bacterium]
MSVTHGNASQADLADGTLLVGAGAEQRASAWRVSLRHWLILICILAAGLVLRGLYIREFMRQPDFAAPALDAEYHDYWARALVTGDWTTPYPGQDPRIPDTPYFRPPGYPYFLALTYRVLGLSYLTPRIVQIGLWLVSCILAFLFAKRWYGVPVALVLVALMSGYWVLIYFENELQAPVLLIPLLWAVVCLAAAWADRMSFGRGVAAGVLLGLAALVRPNVMLLAAPIFVWAGWIAVRRRAPYRFLATVTGCLLGIAVAIAPATIRNYRVSGEFVLMTSNVGINFYIGNNPDADGSVMNFLPGYGSWGNCFEYPALVRNLEQRVGRELNATAVSDYFRDQGLEWIRQNPGNFVMLTIKKALAFWGREELGNNKIICCERLHSSVLRRLPGHFWFVLGSAIAGCVFLVLDAKGRLNRPQTRTNELERRSEVTVLLLGVILVFWLSIIPFFLSSRYRVPVVPLLMVFSAYGVYRAAWCAIRGGNYRAAIVAFAWIGACAVQGRAAPPTDAELADWHESRGVAYETLEDYGSAGEEYQRSLALDPDRKRARERLTIIERELQQRR